MSQRDAELLAILEVGHETSRRGEGISLRTALARTRYKELRPGFGPHDLVPLLRIRRILVDQWLAYSKDKRTTGGWYLLEGGEIGRVEGPRSGLTFGSLEDAVAEYVVRELDFWAASDGAR